MALFLKGKYIGYYPAGRSKAVRDIFRFSKSAENKLAMEITRRDLTTLMGKFWRIESNRFTLHPINEEDPRLGGKVSVRSLVFDARTFTFKMKALYGIYGDDFIQFGEFAGNSSPLNDEERLLKLTESIEDSDDIMYKSTFTFENDNLRYSHEINENLVDTDLHFRVPENELLFSPKTSWSERFFYGVGNQAM